MSPLVTNPAGQSYTHGIILGVFPSTEKVIDVEIQRAIGSSSETFETVFRGLRVSGAFNTAGWFPYEDRTPNDNQTRVYRARHNRDGFTAGSWSSLIRATPLPLPDQPLGIPQLSARVYTTGNNTIGGSSELSLPFGAEVYDFASLHDNSTNNERITVPGYGQGWWRVQASITYSSVSSTSGLGSAQFQLRHVSGATTNTLVTVNLPMDGSTVLASNTAALSATVQNVTYNDYFYVRANSQPPGATTDPGPAFQVDGGTQDETNFEAIYLLAR